MHDLAFLVPYLERFSYIGVFFSSLLSGYLFPVPEEIILLTSGYLAGIDIANPFFVGVVGGVGILCGDSILYFLSRTDHRLIAPLKKRITESALWKSPMISRAHLGRTLFVLRFIVGIRAFGPILAGISNMRFGAFVFWEVLALSVYVPVLVFLGYHFWHSFIMVVTQVEIIRHAFFFAALALAGVLITRFARRELQGREKKLTEEIR